MAPTTRSSKRSLTVLTPNSEEEKPPKRQRVQAQRVVPLNELFKHPELWLTDGNIVLAAGNMCFKVHRSQLARFCTVFEDMFGAPSGGPDEETMEDCVVVRMPDDVADLTSFLEAIYNGSSFNFVTDKAANFPAVSGVMRLATKYECAVLRARILGTLSVRYPSRLELIHGFHVFGIAPYHTRIINLARECDLLNLLPSAFYQLAFRPNSIVPDGGEPLDLLAPADRKRLKQGKDAVLARVMKLVAEGAPDAQPECLQVTRRSKRAKPKSKCAAFLETYWVEQVEPGEDMQGVVAQEPLQELSRLSYPRKPGAMLVQDEERPLCTVCQTTFRKHMQKIIAAVWDNLSVDFML